MVPRKARDGLMEGGTPTPTGTNASSPPDENDPESSSPHAVTERVVRGPPRSEPKLATDATPLEGHRISGPAPTQSQPRIDAAGFTLAVTAGPQPITVKEVAGF